MLKQGIGWGYMPEHMVREDVEKGALVQLDMPELKKGAERLYAIYRTDFAAGPRGLLAHFPIQTQATGAPEVVNQRSIPSASRDL